jgi:hypothetical protein
MFNPQPRPQIQQPDDASIRLIPLTRGQIVIVDADCYEWGMQWPWCAMPSGSGFYAFRGGRSGEQKYIYLHRQLAGDPDGEVDHINGNTLDCRMQNLRACTHQQNIANRRMQKNNTSGFVGVVWNRGRGKWQAQIKVTGKNLNLGLFDNIADAIAARVAAELKYFGQFAHFARDLIVLPPSLQAAG